MVLGLPDINDRSVSVGLCKIRGVPPREWSLSVPDWSLAHKGDAAFERSRQEALQMAPDAVARKREELDRTPRAIMEEALKRAQGKKRRRIPTIRTLHADYVADTERLLAKKRAAGKSIGELVLPKTVTSDEGMLPYRGPAVEAEGESLPADGGGAKARALPAPKALPPVPVRASGKAASLAEIVNRLSAEDKEKLKSLSKDEKADLRRLKSLEDIEAFLALC